MGYRNYSVANGFIVDPSGNGDFKTISLALTAAGSVGGNGTIFIRPGTYTENPALVAGWNLTGFMDDGLTPTVTIIGKCTFSSAGTVSISCIRLQTNSDYFLSITGSAASDVNVDYCYLNASNNTGINFSSSSSSAALLFTNCLGNLGTTGIGLFSHSSAGAFDLEQCSFLNTGASTTASTCSAGVLNLTLCYLQSPITISSTGTTTIEYSAFDLSAINTTCLTLGGASNQAARFCRIISGTASAISVSTTFTISQCTVNSSNTNAITGAGTINYTEIAFIGSSSIINTTTQAGLYTNLGKYKASSQPCFQVYVNSNITSVTGNGAVYPILFDTTKFDLNSNITLNSGGKTIFTAPVAGKYLLNFTIAMN